MKKFLLMVTVAATFLMGSSVFAQNSKHESNQGWNNHGQSYYGEFLKVRRAAPPPRRKHCHKKRVRIHKRWGHGHGHGHKRSHRQKWEWVTYCHRHHNDRRSRKDRRGNRGSKYH